MINIRTILKLKPNDGLTLKAGKIIKYKTGYQVATHGYEVTTPQEAIKLIKKLHGNCGIWYANNIYYIDASIRIKSKREALETGRKHSQISIWNWNKETLIYC